MEQLMVDKIKHNVQLYICMAVKYNRIRGEYNWGVEKV